MYSKTVELPATECAVGWKCVNEIFCDETGTMVAFRVELTQQQKRSRGQLIVSCIINYRIVIILLLSFAAVYESSSGQV